MPRHICLSNSNLLANLDACGWLRDLYWPTIGEPNHILGYPCRTGLAVDGQFHWLDDSCNPKVSWTNPQSSVAEVSWKFPWVGVEVQMRAAVHPDLACFVRQLTVFNHTDQTRNVSLFLHHDFRIAESDIGDTVFFHPGIRALVHHKREFWFACGSFRLLPPVVQYSCGVKAFGGAEGTWRDAEDSHLEMNAIAQGSVDSTLALQAEAPPQGHASFGVWLAAASTLEQSEELARKLTNLDCGNLLEESGGEFQRYLKRFSIAEPVHKPCTDAFARAVQVIRCHTAHTGGIVAANDTDILQSARAHYSYVWPRDGAIISVALARAGQPEAGWRFLEFCRPLITPERPYFLQKYGPTGTVGASWHPWIEHGREIVPFQEDGTALTLWCAGELLRADSPLPPRDWFDEFITPMADFLESYRDPDTHLPLPSYDPWEERRGIHAWTCGAVIAGLGAAADIAKCYGTGKAAFWRQAKEECTAAVRQHFYNHELKRFARTVGLDEKKEVWQDTTPDASIAGLYLFNPSLVDDPLLAETMSQVFSSLEVRTPIGGIARNVGDYYFRVTDDLETVPGNPWIICTLWAARWAAARGDYLEARHRVEWAIAHASTAGLLPEQLHPFSGEPLAVQPLAWSHAELILAMLESGLLKLN